MRSYEAGARRWLGVIAQEVKKPPLRKMDPSFVADVALLAYAGHESTYLNDTIGSLNRERNHAAVGPDNNDPCWSAVNDPPPDHDVYLDTTVTVTAKDERIKKYSAFTAGFLKTRTDLRTELAGLTALYFAGLDPAEFALTEFHSGDDLIRHFGHGDKGALDRLSEIEASEGIIADLGMGPHSIIYQNFRVLPGRFTLADNNPFTAVFNKTYISLCGRDSCFYAVEADVTKEPAASSIPVGSISHAGSNSLTHHIFNDKGSGGLEAFARFMWYILADKGTFRIIDHAEKAPFAGILAEKLESAGFSLELGQARCLSLYWPKKPREPFIIDGRK